MPQSADGSSNDGASASKCPPGTFRFDEEDECRPVDPCAADPLKCGGSSSGAMCVGPFGRGRSACVCKRGYRRVSDRTCLLVDACHKDHGGCDKNAHCNSSSADA